MKRAAWIRLARLLTAIVFAVAAGTWTVGQLRSREVARRDQLELSSPNIDGFDFSSLREAAEEFQSRMTSREQQLSARPDRAGGDRNPESITEIETEHGVIGRMFIHDRQVTEGTAANGMELEPYHFENVAAEAVVRSGGISMGIGAGTYDPDHVDRLSRLAAQLGPNPHNSNPFEPGFCLDGAYIRNPFDASQRERIMLFARLPNHPDIELSLILLAGTKPDEKGLLTRSAESNARLSVVERMRVSQLRVAQRTISGLRGEEVVERFAEDNNVSVFSFWWDAGGTSDDVMLPHLSFKMDTGKSDKGPLPSSLSQEAALALSDKISSSIRYRHAPARPAT